MSAFTLDGRMRLSIALALTARGRDPPRPPDREAEARRLGMCGAEIDAACQRRSFDARTSRALTLAMAAVAPGRDRRHAERAGGQVRHPRRGLLRHRGLRGSVRGFA